MEAKQLIEKAIEATIAVNLQQQTTKLESEKVRLLEPRYRVAFVGKFKTGKSTLINRVILKKDILFTDVLEATSIPTEIDYAETPKLEVYRYERKSFSVDVSDQQFEQNFISGSHLDRSTENPTNEDIRSATSATSPEGRAALAATYSHARLFWPAENLRQFTVVDTPGIDTTNDAVVTTTYRILPECDITIFVTQASQLGQVEIEFLRGRVFESGITRCMLVLHYDPRFSNLSAEQLKRIKEANQATLETIGRGDIPITIAEIARNGGLADGVLGRATTAPPENWIDGSPLNPVAISPELGGTLRFEQDLLQFISKNIRPGKEEKIRVRVRRIVELALTECQMELGLLEKSEAERKKIEAEVIRKQEQTKAETQEIKQDFLSDLQGLKKRHLLKITKGLEILERRFVAEMEFGQSLSEVQSRMRNLKQIAQLETEALAAQISQEVRAEFRELEVDYSLRLKNVASSWQDIDLALKIDGGLLEKAPGWLVVTLDVLLVILVSPFPFFVDIILRYVAEALPLLKNALPAHIATHLLKAFLTKSIVEQFAKVREEVGIGLDSGYLNAEQIFSANWDEQVAEQSSMVADVIERSSNPEDPSRVEALKASIDIFKRLLPELPVPNVSA